MFAWIYLAIVFGFTFLFYVLKKAGYLYHWSWKGVTSPLWLPFVIGFFLLLVFSVLDFLPFNWKEPLLHYLGYDLP